jgi:hypothetical protein
MHNPLTNFLKRSAAIVALISVGSCSKNSKMYGPDVDPAAAGKAAIVQYDANRDGKISGPELDQVPSLKSNLANIDMDHDGALTAEEIAERIRLWQTDQKFGSRMPIHCTVYHNKARLADAEVILVPERFLGKKMKIVKGKTVTNGAAVFMAENLQRGEPPGVAPGFYRVEITKAGADIPARYNTHTALGLDTSTDNPVISKGIHFVLKY